MAKTKAKGKVAKPEAVKAEETPIVEKQTVVEVAPVAPVVATVTTTQVPLTPVQPVQVVQPVQPVQAAVTPAKKGGGCWKWIACCFVVLLICCACTIGTGYLAIFKAGDAVKLLTNSKQDTTLTKITPAEATMFNVDQYFNDHPATDLHNGTFQMTIPEDVFLKLMFGTPDSAFVADYIGIKASNGALKMQIDIGSLAKHELDLNGGYTVLGMKIDTSNFQGIYANIEIASDPVKKLVLRSLKLGDSGIDFAPALQDTFNQYINGGDASSFFANVNSIQFENGQIVMIITGSISDPGSSL